MPSKKKAGGRYVCDQSPFYKLRSKTRLASILKIAPSELIAHVKSANSDYSEFDIIGAGGPKRKKRHIEEPKPKLRRIHKRIETLLRVKPKVS